MPDARAILIGLLSQLAGGAAAAPPPVLPATIASPPIPQPRPQPTIAPQQAAGPGPGSGGGAAGGAPSIAPNPGADTGNPLIDKALTYGGDVFNGVAASSMTGGPLAAFASGFANSRRSRLDREQSIRAGELAAEDRRIAREDKLYERSFDREGRAHDWSRDESERARQARIDAQTAADREIDNAREARLADASIANTQSEIAARGASARAGGLSADDEMDLQKTRMDMLQSLVSFDGAGMTYEQALPLVDQWEAGVRARITAGVAPAAALSAPPPTPGAPSIVPTGAGAAPPTMPSAAAPQPAPGAPSIAPPPAAAPPPPAGGVGGPGNPFGWNTYGANVGGGQAPAPAAPSIAPPAAAAPVQPGADRDNPVEFPADPAGQQAAFDALPVGAYFRNPANGAIMRKLPPAQPN